MADIKVQGIDLSDPAALNALELQLARELNIDAIDINLEVVGSNVRRARFLSAGWKEERRTLGGSQLTLSISSMSAGSSGAVVAALSSDTFFSSLSLALAEQGYNVSVAVTSLPTMTSEFPAGEVWDLDQDGDFRLRACPEGNDL